MSVIRKHTFQNIKKVMLSLALVSSSLVFAQQKSIVEGSVKSTDGAALSDVVRIVVKLMSLIAPSILSQRPPPVGN